MDVHDKETGRERQREEALARRLAEAFDRLGSPAADECPDAEQIAAYHQRTLSLEEDTQCETHFAACTRCRKILTVLAASADVSVTGQPLTKQEVARLGALATAAQRPLAAKPQRPRAFPWRFPWPLPWLVPALGVAAALAVWFIVRPPWRLAAPDSSQVLVAQAPKAAAPIGGENAATAGNSTGNNVAEPLNAPARDAAPPAQPTAPAAKSLDKLAASDNAASQALKDETTARTEAGRAVGGAGGGIGAFATPELSREAASAPAPAAPPQPTSQPTTVAPPAAQGEIRALRQQAAPAAASARANAPLVAVDALNAGFSVTLQSPSSGVSWRAGTGGRIERSTDGGRTWQAQASPLRENWLAGSAVSDAVCWLVGANGAIARTLDGERWERIAPPPAASTPAVAASGRQPDWIAVTASSAQTATITAADQQRYSTQDGGRTWRKQ